MKTKNNKSDSISIKQEINDTFQTNILNYKDKISKFETQGKSCDYCTKLFLHNNQLNAHIKIKHLDIYCEQSHRDLKTNTVYKNLVHSCMQCDIVITLKVNLIEHVLVHKDPQLKKWSRKIKKYQKRKRRKIKNWKRRKKWKTLEENCFREI